MPSDSGSGQFMNWFRGEASNLQPSGPEPDAPPFAPPLKKAPAVADANDQQLQEKKFPFLS
jgi:hypothetical protein